MRVLNSRRLFSVMKPGPLGTTWAVTLPGADFGPVARSWSSSDSSVSLSQSVAKTTLSVVTIGPRRQAISSTHSRPTLRCRGLL